MTDLIRVLADQAIAYANETWNPDSEPERFVLIAMRKHAELIIAECAQKLENDGMVEVAMEIEWHFGVRK